ncbi:aspartyl protease family protein [Candidatus Nomurabacteria bacterium]|nr:aspartyl protease family protein [Candidatus Kaiserbacteria bacterium]MCB9813802.1 aspartyl protease family protein [Candidatus Nomurabacteria bacterium]
MAVSNSLLGMNARNYLYIQKFNSKRNKQVADDKLLTKERLLKFGVPTNSFLAKFSSLHDVREFDWKSLPTDFAIKPSHGYGGRGIFVVRKWDGEKGSAGKGKPVDILELERVIFGALDGEHSLNNLPDTVFIEERIRSHSFFKKYIPKGVPDIRLIVCNMVPVMAMMRLPTIYSEGKANLHMGALGVGIDLRTGITTSAVLNNKQVSVIPGGKIKVHGIRIPDWDKIMEIAVQAQQCSKLGFAGIDIVLDEKLGPLVLEVNARPGLGIQIANQASLRTRLERIADLKVQTVSRGVELAKKLFAEESLEEVSEQQSTLLGVIEKITIFGNDKNKTVRAKVDTGAYRTSIDSDLVEELDLDSHHKLIQVRSGSGRQKRRTVKLRFKMKGKEIETIATYTPRGHLRFPVIIGRKDMGGFLVDPKSIPEGVLVK